MRWTVGAIEVTRVADPEFELLLPQDPDTQALLARSRWLAPQFVTPDRQLRIGSSAIVVRTPSALIVVDPFLAFDDPARIAPRLSALRRAGCHPDDVDFVIDSHLDGIGLNLAAGGEPAFPRARYLIPSAEMEDVRLDRHPEIGASFAALAQSGLVDETKGGEAVVPGVRLEDAPGHNSGHVVVWLESGGSAAVIAGHLFLHPSQIASPDVVLEGEDPVVLPATRRSVLKRCVEEQAVLIGPLFATPGGGHVGPAELGWRLMSMSAGGSGSEAK